MEISRPTRRYSVSIHTHTDTLCNIRVSAVKKMFSYSLMIYWTTSSVLDDNGKKRAGGSNSQAATMAGKAIIRLRSVWQLQFNNFWSFLSMCVLCVSLVISPTKLRPTSPRERETQGIATHAFLLHFPDIAGEMIDNCNVKLEVCILNFLRTSSMYSKFNRIFFFFSFIFSPLVNFSCEKCVFPSFSLDLSTFRSKNRLRSATS